MFGTDSEDNKDWELELFITCMKLQDDSIHFWPDDNLMPLELRGVKSGTTVSKFKDLGQMQNPEMSAVPLNVWTGVNADLSYSMYF